MIFQVNIVDDVHLSLATGRGESTGVMQLQFDADVDDVLGGISQEDLIEYAIKNLPHSELLDKMGKEDCMDHFNVTLTEEEEE
jgi:hypothetical protein